jgi:hypothetical protein
LKKSGFWDRIKEEKLSNLTAGNNKHFTRAIAMGNIIEIKDYFNERLENITDQKQKLIADKQKLEKRLEEIDRLIEEGQTAADRYFDDELLVIGVELGIINRQLKIANHKEWKSREKIERYQGQDKKKAEAK